MRSESLKEPHVTRPFTQFCTSLLSRIRTTRARKGQTGKPSDQAALNHGGIGETP